MSRSWHHAKINLGLATRTKVSKSEIRQAIMVCTREAMALKNLGTRDVARISHVSVGLVSQLANGKGNPTIDSVTSVLNALGISWDDLAGRCPL